jgi:hypothetical protein
LYIIILGRNGEKKLQYQFDWQREPSDYFQFKLLLSSVSNNLEISKGIVAFGAFLCLTMLEIVVGCKYW